MTFVMKGCANEPKLDIANYLRKLTLPERKAADVFGGLNGNSTIVFVSYWILKCALR